MLDHRRLKGILRDDRDRPIGVQHRVPGGALNTHGRLTGRCGLPDQNQTPQGESTCPTWRIADERQRMSSRVAVTGYYSTLNASDPYWPSAARLRRKLNTVVFRALNKRMARGLQGARPGRQVRFLPRPLICPLTGVSARRGVKHAWLSRTECRDNRPLKEGWLPPSSELGGCRTYEVTCCVRNRRSCPRRLTTIEECRKTCCREPLTGWSESNTLCSNKARQAGLSCRHRDKAC